MNPVETMTSESQERMLAIVRPDNLDEVLALCDKWEIRATVVGTVTDTGRFRVYDGLFDALGVPGENPKPPSGDAPVAVSSDREPIADIPCDSLGDGPVYTRPIARPDTQDALNAADPWAELSTRFGAGVDLSDELLALLATPTVADTSWVSRQYDHQLFLNTIVAPGADAAVLRLKGTSRGLAISTDGKGRFCRLDPRDGGRLAVLEAARNVACAGADPKALVNCLNFGNPEHPEVMWQFQQVVEGISEACEALGIPVIGGNVSFYNESRGTDIDPTPVVGVVGLIDALTDRPPIPRVAPPEHLVVLGETRAELGGSEWAAVVHGLGGGRPPAADLATAARLHSFVKDLVVGRSVTGVHDCSDGGLAVALAEIAFGSGCGFTLTPETDLPAAAWCFAESASRVVIGVDARPLPHILRRAADAGIHAVDLGGRWRRPSGHRRSVRRRARRRRACVARRDPHRAWSGYPRIVVSRRSRLAAVSTASIQASATAAPVGMPAMVSKNPCACVAIAETTETATAAVTTKASPSCNPGASPARASRALDSRGPISTTSTVAVAATAVRWPDG